MDYKPTPKRLAVALTATSMAAIIFAAITSDFVASAETRSFSQSGFTALRVRSGLEVVVAVGPAFSISAEGEAESIDTVDIHMDGATLVAERRRNWRETLFPWSSDSQRVLLNITMPTLSALEADAGAYIEVSGDISQPLQAMATAGASVSISGVNGAAMDIDARGGASIVATGTCANIKALASGGASVNMGALDCATATADASGGASLVVNARDTVSVGATGGASLVVKIRGQEVLREDVSAGGVLAYRP